jgi:hypothetical protein
MARLLSGRVGVTSYAGLSTDRNQIVDGELPFLGLQDVEPNLGLSPQNSYVLYGDADGTRRWGTPSGAPSGSVEGITVRDEGLTPVGFAGSTTILDFVGTGVEVTQSKIDQGGVEVGLTTITIPPIPLKAEDGNGFVQVTGITTIRVGSGLSVIQPTGEVGVASISSIAELDVDVYDDRGYLSVPNASTLQAGVGLSVTAPQANRAKFDVTGRLPSLKVSGISTLTQTQVTDINATGIVTASSVSAGTSVTANNFYGNVIGDVTGNLTGEVNAAAFDTNASGIVVSGIATATEGFNGNINSTGVSSITYLQGDNINVTGVVTATTFAGYGLFRTIHQSETRVIDVKVDDKTSDHRYTGVGSTQSFYLDGTQAPFLTLVPGRTYRFDQSDPSNTGHPLRLFYDAGKQREYNDNVTTSGTPGIGGAYIEILITEQAPTILYYQCNNHDFMGNEIQANTIGRVEDLIAVGVVTSTAFYGPLIGNVTGDVNGNVTGDITGKITGDVYSGIVTATKYLSGNINSTGVSTVTFIQADTVNATGIITASSFDGTVPSSNLSGALPALDGSALTNVVSNTIDVVATNTTNATHYMMFAENASGQQTLRSDTGITYNPSLNQLSVASLVGTLTGTSTGLAGTPDISVGNIECYNITPASHNTYNLGTATIRFANIYSADLQLSNKDATPNSVDGTWGDWTLQEGEHDIFMLNNRTGKRYKINLTEV